MTETPSQFAQRIADPTYSPSKTERNAAKFDEFEGVHVTGISEEDEAFRLQFETDEETRENIESEATSQMLEIVGENSNDEQTVLILKDDSEDLEF